MRQGKFITFEGIDGSGKSSVIEAVAEYLDAQKIEVVLSRQPGGSELGEKMRTILKDPATKITPLTEVLLLAASFRECLVKIIRPAIAKGQWVLCDRWTDSTLAYQCGARQLPREVVEPILRAAASTKPEMTILCDVPPETAAERAKARGEADRFEAEGLVFQKAVHRFYAENTAKRPKAAVVDTGLLGPKEAGLAAIEILKSRLGA